MAENLRKSEGQAVERPPAPILLTPRRPQIDRLQGLRGPFALAYLVLGIVLGGAIAGVIVLVSRDGSSSTATAVSSSTWSAWQPAGIGVDRLQEIARHVAAEHRLATGDQLVAVRAQPAEYQSLPLTTMIVHTGFPVENPQDLFPYDVSRSAQYFMCGAGASCAVTGKPTVERGLLIRREALELALMTFKYVPQLNSTIVFVPPAANQPPVRLLLFLRADFGSELGRPLQDTIGPIKRVTMTSLSTSVQTTIDDLTRTRFYERLTQGGVSELGDGTVAYVTKPLIG